ncbi:hypothetical protein B0A49_09381 [Cryomyces minteri]|uniref:Uncharacterized protein n=1 Tax=Cryomyces minteri TaxID=331657 RepID=A0A4V5NGG6_9PEZI|nr:hypothetical protein B0A49_09381 [Cryomyces minteri]
MYKPDPMLPPEQQMLPTHAKRMLQEQWEKEGKTGSVYDRDFELLHSGEFDTRESSLPSESGVQEARKAEDPPSPWPLKSQKSETKSEAKSETRSEARSGGYKITPTISSPQIRPQGVPQRPVLSPKPSQPNQVTRLPEPLNEKSKEKKSLPFTGGHPRTTIWSEGFKQADRPICQQLIIQRFCWITHLPHDVRRIQRETILRMKFVILDPLDSFKVMLSFMP